MKKVFEKWWLAQTKKGNPLRNPNLVDDAFKAGYEAGYKAGYCEAERDGRDIAAEAGWKERQGEDYGSY